MAEFFENLFKKSFFILVSSLHPDSNTLYVALEIRAVIATKCADNDP